MTHRTSRFLTAEWRQLILLNYEVDPAILSPLIPAGTELDLWEGKALASIVGFLFLDTRVLGIPIPFHRNFEEVNLRFYVRRKTAEGWRRAVVFVKELVPRRAIAWAANAFYNENYQALPMGHRLTNESDQHPTAVSYWWKTQGRKNHLKIEVEGALQPIAEGSHEEFITEHYWGYCRQRDGGTIEYEVEHPRWQTRPAKRFYLDCYVEALYGPAFVPFLQREPISAFLAEGSKITVFQGSRIALESSAP